MILIGGGGRVVGGRGGLACVIYLYFQLVDLCTFKFFKEQIKLLTC